MNELKQKYTSGEIDKSTFIDLMFEKNQQLFEYVKILNGTDIKKIEITDKGVLFTSRETDTKFFCTKNDKRTAPFEIMNFNKYEGSDADLMYSLIKDGDTIFDIGANIGWYSLNISNKYPNVKIYSFEPIPETFQQLSYNIKLNGNSNIQNFNFGFSDQEKIIEFFVSEYTSVSSSAQNLTEENHVKLVECKVVLLDDFTSKRSLHIDFIKVDVEGAELLVFKGAQETIKRDSPIIFTEMLRKWSAKFNYHPNDIITFFKNLNYKCYTGITINHLREVDEITEETLETNFIFLNLEQHAKIINTYAK